MSYCLPEIPQIFWINSIDYKCILCGFEFNHLAPNGDDLIKYQEENGSEIRWLPIRGKGCYLDLLSKLIPCYNPKEPITINVVKEFNKKLRMYIEPSLTGNTFILAEGKHRCPKCNSGDLVLLKEEVLVTPKIEWIKVSCDLIK
jgi:DNA-directed RNA polymerase subunit RPC12/RpoP